jgi:sterol 14-demethylase
MVDPITVIAAILVVFATLLIGRVVLNSMPGKTPPVFEGIPFVGGLLKFIEGPMTLMTNGYAKFGEVFTVPVGHKRITFLIGPDVAPHFFKASDDLMSQDEVYGYSVPTFGKGVVFDVDRKVRLEQFRFFTEALTKERLKKYVPMFVSEAEDYFAANWGNEGIVDLNKEFGRLVTLTAARTLLGREVREQMFEEVTHLLHELDEGMLPISVIAPYLPIAAHRKRDKARIRMAEIFAKIIRNRRANNIKEEDALQQFIDARYSPNCNGGRATTEEECVGMLIAVLFAGQHTSSITTSWTGYFMIDNKSAAWAPAIKEQQEMMKKHGDTINFDNLQEMEVLQRNVMEALRLHPPLIMLLRFARQSFSVTDSKGKQYEIPKGDIVAASPNFSHRLPGVFKNPDAYEPDRYTAPREEDKAKPFSYIGFGGGRHACIGSNFAYLQIKTIMSIVLRNFELELLDPVPLPDYHSMVVGPLPARVKYTRRKLVV